MRFMFKNSRRWARLRTVVVMGTLVVAGCERRRALTYQNSACDSLGVAATSQPGNKSDTAAVIVTCPGSVASVTVSPARASVHPGETVQLTTTIRDSNGNALTGRLITWASSNPAVATVSGGGLVRRVTVGSATITATSEAKSGSSAITVPAPPPPGSGAVVVGAGDIAGCSSRD